MPQEFNSALEEILFQKQAFENLVDSPLYLAIPSLEADMRSRIEGLTIAEHILRKHTTN